MTVTPLRLRRDVEKGLEALAGKSVLILRVRHHYAHRGERA